MHSDRGGCEGVGGWEHESTPILAIFIGSVGWAGDDVVPPARNIMIRIRFGRSLSMDWGEWR